MTTHLVLTSRQLRMLADLYARATFSFGAAHSGSGWYDHEEEYPEEGALFLPYDDEDEDKDKRPESGIDSDERG